MGPEASGVEPRMMARVISDLGSARQPAISAHMSTSEPLSNKNISYRIRLERKNREKKKMCKRGLTIAAT
jgi:hypothetical protein